MSVIKIMAQDAGINPDRVTIQWVSGAEGPRFAEKVTEFTERIRALGPNSFAGRPSRIEEVVSCQ